MKINIGTCTLEELEDECINVLGTPYGHNMIALMCSQAEKRFGGKEADRLFETYQM